LRTANAKNGHKDCFKSPNNVHNLQSAVEHLFIQTKQLLVFDISMFWEK